MWRGDRGGQGGGRAVETSGRSQSAAEEFGATRVRQSAEGKTGELGSTRGNLAYGKKGRILNQARLYSANGIRTS
jgi:hypothetical protein